jgi:hypothetical protein
MLTENQVEVSIAKFMQMRGWRRRRNHVGVFRPIHGGAQITIGTRGECDWSYYRTAAPGIVQVLHVEAKRPGAKPRPEQDEYIASLNHIGETALYADSIDMFISKYNELNLDTLVYRWHS